MARRKKKSRESDIPAVSTPPLTPALLPAAMESTAKAPPEAPIAKPAEVDPLQELTAVFQAAEFDTKQARKAVGKYLAHTVKSHDVLAKYNFVIIHDETRLTRDDADKIYTAIRGLDEKKPMLLSINSRGGSVEAGYMISKVCREHSKGFTVVVPRSAKSAATLVCCGADAIHMGGMSELGPIDPQIEGMPTLGLKSAVQHLADLVASAPAAADMFATYMSKVLKLEQLGYYERVAESAVQYAERLLTSSGVFESKNIKSIANRLVYEYKDHGFVIDRQEAKDIFGAGFIHEKTAEYELANAAYSSIGFVAAYCKILAKKQVYFVGTLDQGAYFYTAP